MSIERIGPRPVARTGAELGPAPATGEVPPRSLRAGRDAWLPRPGPGTYTARR